MPTRAGGASADDAEQADNDALASALGVKNVQRISKALVEAAFDGDLEEVSVWKPLAIPSSSRVDLSCMR